MKNFLKTGIFFCAVYLLSFGSAFAAAIEFESKEESVSGTLDEGQEPVCHAVVKNISTSAKDVALRVSGVKVASGHSFSICWDKCIPDITTDKTFGSVSIESGGNSGNKFHADLTPSGLLGTSRATFTFVNAADFADYISFSCEFIVSVNGVNDGTQTTTISSVTYPNPANNYVEVRFDKAISGDVQTQLFSASGEIVKNENVNLDNSQLRFATGDLSDGSYNLIISQNGKVLAQSKIIVAK